MNNKETIPAEAEKPCNCCARLHRKLFNIDGFCMGKTCADNYKLYKRSDGKEVTAIFWRGYEKQFNNIVNMVTK